MLLVLDSGISNVCGLATPRNGKWILLETGKVQWEEIILIKGNWAVVAEGKNVKKLKLKEFP